MATGIITIKNPNGKSGTFRVVTVGPDDECDTEIDCQNKELTFVDPQGSSGVQQGGNAIGKIVNAGNSGIMVVINIQPN
jgi:hypothetical protein